MTEFGIPFTDKTLQIFEGRVILGIGDKEKGKRKRESGERTPVQLRTLIPEVVVPENPQAVESQARQILPYFKFSHKPMFGGPRLLTMNDYDQQEQRKVATIAFEVMFDVMRSKLDINDPSGSIRGIVEQLRLLEQNDISSITNHQTFSFPISDLVSALSNAGIPPLQYDSPARPVDRSKQQAEVIGTYKKYLGMDRYFS